MRKIQGEKDAKAMVHIIPKQSKAVLTKDDTYIPSGKTKKKKHITLLGVTFTMFAYLGIVE